jgi:hypothetical protein
MKRENRQRFREEMHSTLTRTTKEFLQMQKQLQNNAKKPFHMFEFFFLFRIRNFLGLGTSWNLAIFFVNKVLVVNEFPFYKVFLQLLI